MLRRLAPALVLSATALTALLSGCGPAKGNETTVDALSLQRGVLIGAPRDAPPGTRALSVKIPKNLGQLEDEQHRTLFGDGGEVKLTGYINGVLPDAGKRERAHGGDRVGWLVRDTADIAAIPEAVVGLFPAPFTARFTAKRRLMPTRVQCLNAATEGCRATSQSLAKAGIQSGISAANDAASTTTLRVYVGPWAQLRDTLAKGRLRTALAIETAAQQNGYGVSISADGRTVQFAAAFGQDTLPQPVGAGAGLIFAIRDTLENPVWIVTGTDEAGVTRAAKSLSAPALAGRVAAVATK